MVLLNMLLFYRKREKIQTTLAKLINIECYSMIYPLSLEIEFCTTIDPSSLDVECCTTIDPSSLDVECCTTIDPSQH